MAMPAGPAPMMMALSSFVYSTMVPNMFARVYVERIVQASFFSFLTVENSPLLLGLYGSNKDVG